VPSISELLTTLPADSATLVQRLTERKAQIVQSWTDLRALQADLETARSDLAKSQTELTEISTSLDASKLDNALLSKQFADYKQESKARIATLEIKAALYKNLTVSFVAVLGVGAIYEGGRALGWWR
jgi:hypothetical protein